jgi:CRP-like cAMP-binding protein
MSGPCPHNDFCCSLSEATQNRLCRACLRLHLKPRQEVLFEQSARQVAIVKEGVIISLFLTDDGSQKSVELLKAGDVIGADHMFHGPQEQTGYMLAMADSILCLFPAEVFETFYQQNQDFSRAVLKGLSSRFHKTLDALLWAKTSSSEDKIRKVFEFLKEAGVNPAYLTHEDLALIADLNRVTVTRAIKTINQLG